MDTLYEALIPGHLYSVSKTIFLRPTLQGFPIYLYTQAVNKENILLYLGATKSDLFWTNKLLTLNSGMANSVRKTATYLNRDGVLEELALLPENRNYIYLNFLYTDNKGSQIFTLSLKSLEISKASFYRV